MFGKNSVQFADEFCCNVICALAGNAPVKNTSVITQRMRIMTPSTIAYGPVKYQTLRLINWLLTKVGITNVTAAPGVAL